MLWQLPPFRIGVVSQPCTGWEGLAALVRKDLPLGQGYVLYTKIPFIHSYRVWVTSSWALDVLYKTRP